MASPIRAICLRKFPYYTLANSFNTIKYIYTHSIAETANGRKRTMLNASFRFDEVEQMTVAKLLKWQQIYN